MASSRANIRDTAAPKIHRQSEGGSGGVYQQTFIDSLCQALRSQDADCGRLRRPIS